MKRKERYIARLDEVIITREDDSAVIRYKEEGMLTTYAGWGMRIEFVPDDQLHRRPTLEVREPDPEGGSAES
jgi:hypothetical protein